MQESSKKSLRSCPAGSGGSDRNKENKRTPVLVTRTFLPPMEEYMEALKPVWESAWVTNMGAQHEALKSELKEYLGADSLELFTNGHLALEMSLQALGLPRGSEVITTPYTFASTTHAIVRNGLVPVFCDIRRSDCTMDPEKIEELITEKTSAILPVHVYGQVCDVEAIGDIAARHGLKVVYDAAHAFGERYKGRGVCCYGDASMLSFHATKVFHTIEGGAVVYPDHSLDDILYQLKNFGILDQEHVAYVGGNAKMNEFQAVMGLVNLRHIGRLIELRRRKVELYRSLLAGHEGIVLLEENPDTEYNYAYMPVIFEAPFDRDEVFARLTAHGIFPRKYFYPAVNAYDCYKDSYDAEETPAALDVSRKVLTLPLYPELEDETVREICGLILE